MIQTKNLVIADKGLKLDIDPKEITSPSGIENINVVKKSLRVCKKPTLRADITVGNCSIILERFIKIPLFITPKQRVQIAPSV